MEIIRIKAKINILSVFLIIVMSLLYLIFQTFIKTLNINTLYFVVSGIIFSAFILVREFTKKNKYTTFFSYLLCLVLLFFSILLFQQTEIHSNSRIIYYIGFSFYIMTLIFSIISLFFSHTWYRKNLRKLAHILIFISIAVIISNLVVNYSWNDLKRNILLIIICISMLNVLIEAVSRSFAVNFLHIFKKNFVFSGFAFLLLLVVIVMGL